MNVSPHDTIAALSTPWMSSGVAVIRVSGPLVRRLIDAWLSFPIVNVKARYFYKASFCVDSLVVDEGLWVYFPSPHSYTGEDVLELYPHGSIVVLQAILKELVSRGVRMAREGEFTQRSFLAGKLDLSQAEAVHELIEAVTLEGAVAASQSIRGAVSLRCHALEKKLTELRVLAESYLDFSDQDMDPEDFSSLKLKLVSWLSEAKSFCNEAGSAAKQFTRVSVAILGSPNVGKSSMMNLLAKTDASIVSDRAGTTRDIVMSDVLWGSRRVHLLDTAGIRETDCPIEQEGISRIQRRLGDASCILWVLEANSPELEREASDAIQWLSHFSLVVPVLFVLNKTDLCKDHSPPSQLSGREVVAVSCVSNEGFDALIAKVLACVGGGMNSARFYANQRQVSSIAEAISSMEKALMHPQMDELFAQDLYFAHRCLMQVLGHFSTEDLLGDIFSKFCIGK